MRTKFNLSAVCKRLWISASVIFCITLSCSFAIGQTATPSPTPQPAGEGDYIIISSFEAGARGTSVNGNVDKYRSDLNYKAGFRLWDSSFYVEDHTKGAKLFDKFLVTSSGWDGDPSGYLRSNMTKEGIYSFDASVRTVKYFNNLNNIALSEHDADTRHNFGDFDLVVFPERDFKLRFGYSFNHTHGDGGYTTRAFSDEFPVTSFISSRSDDIRAGTDLKLFGFNLAFMYGYRQFNDTTRYTLLAPNVGNNPTNTGRMNTFDRSYPIKGNSNFFSFNAQRTFAKKFDFTGRVIYSSTTSRFTLNEAFSGIDNSNNRVDRDQVSVNGDSKRPQTRADAGLTWRATEKLRISDTFTFDQFNIGGGNLFAEAVISRTPTGGPRPTTITNTLSNEITSYQREMNLFEVDYQVNNYLAFNAGYRYTHRHVVLEDFIRDFATTVPSTSTEDFTNSTNSFLAGARIKPMKNWSIYADFETGRADNVFTRLANYQYTNFRIRSQAHYKRFSLGLSAFSRDNTNPSGSDVTLPTNFVAVSRVRTYSGNLDWEPMDQLSLSTGYTYQYQTTSADIRVPINSAYFNGVSQFLSRDSYFFFDVTAHPIKRVSMFASYRIDDDQGQNGQLPLRAQDIITSYPFRFQQPEIRLAIRLTRNIDWNLGYQYYSYRENLPNAQNYTAHLPYTSLRFYFGRPAAER